MNHTAEIKAVKETDKGTYIKLYVPNSFLKYDIERYKQEGNKALTELRIDDGRRINNQQRKKYFATLKDIADHTGNVLEDMHDYFKFLYCYRNRVETISMSDCSVTEAREMINIIMDFALENDVPLKDLGVNRTDDIGRYLYKCIALRICVCCGKARSDFHHSTAVGMGRDRKKINHIGLYGMTLCREHHSIIHQMGEKDFFNKHKVYPLELDKYTVKKLKLSTGDIT